MIRVKQACAFVLAAISPFLTTGCLILYLPQTYHYAEVSAVSAPYKSVSIEFNESASNAPVTITLEDSDSSKLKSLRFVDATMMNEDGNSTRLSLHRENLENPNSFVMEFYKADYLGHDLHFRVTVRSEKGPVVITFQTRFKTKVYWPKDSDYSG